MAKILILVLKFCLILFLKKKKKIVSFFNLISGVLKSSNSIFNVWAMISSPKKKKKKMFGQ